MDVGGWLRGLGLGQYEALFRASEIDADILPELTADDLKELGVAAIGHRRLLLKAIADQWARTIGGIFRDNGQIGLAWNARYLNMFILSRRSCSLSLLPVRHRPDVIFRGLRALCP